VPPRPRGRRKITQTDVDFLLLGIFGAKALPDEIAERIAARREFARGIAAALDRLPGGGLEIPEAELASVVA
jgi:hypothetical protein